MGQDIDKSKFTAEDEKEFSARLLSETNHLREWFKEQRFDKSEFMCGYELEAWLVDKTGSPSPKAPEFIEKLGDKNIVPEISMFNFEINGSPFPLGDGLLHKLEKDFSISWNKCVEVAQNMGVTPVYIGSLPTVKEDELCLKYMSPQKRYYALNDRVLDFRGGKPIVLDIQGKEMLRVEHKDVMAEAAATSLQIHLGVSQDQAVKYYNASLMASPLMVALCANSPFLYGKELWDETRISIFEQAVNFDNIKMQGHRMEKRVTFGNGYAGGSLFDLFTENIDKYPVLLPILFDDKEDIISHLRLHNGTIWRWNRPLIGFNEQGNPHLRIEHRTPSAGPTAIDMVAGMAFYLGFTHYIASLQEGPEELISFENLKYDFYDAAKNGFNAQVHWINGKRYNVRKLILAVLPKVRKSLLQMGISAEEVDHYINGVIRSRLLSGQNGANWQKQYYRNHGSCFKKMLETYIENQSKGNPVHTWKI